MTEINKIDLLKIDARLQARKKSTQQSQDSNARFEDQLLKTVKKLETMGNEIDAMMQNSAVQMVPKMNIDQTVQKKDVGNLDSIVENFSAAGKTSIKSAKSIAAEYEAMNQRKQS